MANNKSNQVQAVVMATNRTHDDATQDPSNTERCIAALERIKSSMENMVHRFQEGAHLGHHREMRIQRLAKAKKVGKKHVIAANVISGLIGVEHETASAFESTVDWYWRQLEDGAAELGISLVGCETLARKLKKVAGEGSRRERAGPVEKRARLLAQQSDGVDCEQLISTGRLETPEDEYRAAFS